MAALLARSRSFKFILDGFPQGFLPKELTLLVQRSLIDVCDQLAKLDPSNPEYANDIALTSEKLAEVQRQDKTPAQVELKNHQQIKSVRQCLEELFRFVAQIEQKSLINRSQAEAYRLQIKNLVLQITIDGYSINGRASHQNGKLKLALHYYDLAVRLLAREDSRGHFHQKATKLKDIRKTLQEALATEEAEQREANPEAEAESEAEWDKLREEDGWQKKNFYE